MIKLIVGKKGTGKTKQLIDMMNDSVGYSEIPNGATQIFHHSVAPSLRVWTLARLTGAFPGEIRHGLIAYTARSHTSASRNCRANPFFIAKER